MPVAHLAGGSGVVTPLLGLKKQHGFVDTSQFVTLCRIYFSLNNHLSYC